MKTVNFTRGGDKGTTSLYGGKRVSKNNAAVEAVGTLDELNSVIGYSLALCNNSKSKIQKFLVAVQNDLFDIQSLLAGYDKNYESRIRNYELRVKEMERLIEELDHDLPQLKNFIIPGGSLLGAQFHVCRTVCRRAERRVFTYTDAPIKYLNRLSSLFFVLSRWVNHREKWEELKWNLQRPKTA